MKDKLGSPAVLVTGDLKGKCGRSLLSAATENHFPGCRVSRADVFITGRASFDVTVDAPESNIAVIEAGHYYTKLRFTRCRQYDIKIYPGIIIEYYNSNPSVLL